MRRRSACLAATFAALFAVAPTASAQIAEPDLRTHLEALDRIARDNGGHRAAGTPGETQTGDYAAARLAEAGWTITRTDVPFPYWAERSPSIVGSYRPDADFVILHYSGGGDVTARTRAINADPCRRRAFRRVPRGRIAVLAAGDCTFRRTARLAQRAGARAILVADFTNGPPVFGTLISPGIRLPVLSVRLPIARRLARREPRIRVRTDVISERRVTQNVIAELPGTEQRRVVMAGGHMDSVPRGPGMNDNGSGVVSLIEAGRRLATLPRGRATVRLAFWSAHESGVFGAPRYVRALPRSERRRLSAYLNIDMVASPNGVPEIYATSRRLRTLLERQIPGAGRTSADSGSDHAAFMRIGVPIAGIYTGSLEPKSRRQARRWGGTWGKERDACYHDPCDGIGNVNLPMLARSASATANALEQLAR